MKTSTTYRITKEFENGGLIDFYNYIAEQAGIEFNWDDYKLDCKRLDISEQMQANLINKIKEQMDTEDEESILTMLLLYGPKAPADLESDMFRIDEGFIIKEEI